MIDFLNDIGDGLVLILLIINGALLLYFVAATIHSLLAVIGMRLYRPVAFNFLKKSLLNNIAIIIPAYKEDGIIVNSLLQNLKVDYPRSHFKLFLAADSFIPDTLESLKNLDQNLEVVEVKFEVSTKSKSIHYVLNKIEENQYPITVILDADNVVEKDFLNKINQAYNEGKRAIQANRIYKNLNTNIAIIDAISEATNHNIYRKGQNGLGLSSCLVGSGMAFDTSLFKKVIDLSLNSIGEDRVIQNEILLQGEKIFFLDNCFVADEKVSKYKSFKNQRQRWLTSQLEHLRQYFFKSVYLSLKGDPSILIMAIVNNLFTPRILVLGSGLFFTIINLSMNVPSTMRNLWLISFLTYCALTLLAIPRSFYKRNLLLKVLRYSPMILLTMFSLMLRKNKNKGVFVRTEHTNTGPFSF